MSDLYVWLTGVVVFLGGLIAAYFGGKSKAKSTGAVEVARKEQMAAQAAAERQTSVSKEAANVDQKVANSSVDNVDSELLDKWTRK